MVTICSSDIRLKIFRLNSVIFAEPVQEIKRNDRNRW